MESLNHLWAAIQAVVTSSDYITLAIIAVVAIAAGFMMDGMASLLSVTVVALVTFGILNYVRGVAMNGENASAYASTTLHNFEVAQMLTVLAYAVVFAILIAIVNVVRSLVLR